MNTKKGISIIVLVITIIVMIVLAATILISLTNNNVIDNANKAVEDTELANIRTLASNVWSDAYVAGNKTQGDLKKEITEKLTESGFDLKKYIVTVTTEGITVEKSGGWSLEKTNTGSKVTSIKIKKGNQQIDVGTVVNYTAPTAKNYSGTWKILGVDEQGKIKLMSTESIDNKKLLGKAGYKNGIAELNIICDGYADGVKAESSRSIKTGDIDELTGYDKTTYGANQINQYGNVVTYSWDADANLSYAATNGLTGKWTSSRFTYYDETIKDFVTKQKEPGVEITNIISSYYYYAGSKYLDSTIEAYKMIFKDATGTTNAPTYWLASSTVNTNSNYVYFGLGIVLNDLVREQSLVRSDGFEMNNTFGCRVVVTLKSDISLVADGETGTYNIV